MLKYGVQGSAQSHIIPILDSCVAKRNRTVPYVDLEYEEALNLLKEAFTVATEVLFIFVYNDNRETKIQVIVLKS